MAPRDDGPTRRRFLTATGAAGVAVTLAGCGGGTTGSEETTEGSPDDDTDAQSTTDASETTAAPDGDDRYGGTFTYGMSTQPESVGNVTQATSVYGSLALSLCYDYPVNTNHADEPVPWLYSDWTLAETDGDWATAHFDLRDGATFGDGSAVTTEDVVFTYDYIIEHELSAFADVLSNVRAGSVAEADADWDLTAEVKPVLAWPVNTIGAAPILPKAVWEGTDPQRFDPVAEGQAFGTGPGEVTRWDAATAIRVEMVNDWYRETLNRLDWVEDDPLRLAGGPFVDAVNFRVYGSESAMTNAFLDGDVDTHYGSISPSRREDVLERDGLSLLEGYDSGFGYFAFNLERAPTDDTCFRQALGFMWDERFWVESLNDGAVLDGDYPQSPGYPAGRPETYFDDADLLADPSSELYAFRRREEGSPVPDVEAVRGFLESGAVATGEGGTHAGVDYPGTLFDVTAAESEARHDYSFGPVESDLLAEQSSTEVELRVDGETLTERRDGDPLTVLITPPTEQPRQARGVSNWLSNLRAVGVPIETEVLSFNALEDRVFYEQEFDVSAAGWGDTSAYGGTNYFFFHSDWHTEGSESYDYNFTGYGVGDVGYDEELAAAYGTLDTREAAERFAKSMERVYLDAPYRVYNYSKIRWPLNTAEWAGAVEEIVDPAYASWPLEANNVHRRG
jgi:peptide/nickel transport system substrate-binding protein